MPGRSGTEITPPVTGNPVAWSSRRSGESYTSAGANSTNGVTGEDAARGTVAAPRICRAPFPGQASAPRARAGGRHVVEQVAQVDHQGEAPAERPADPAGQLDDIPGRGHHRLDLERPVPEGGQPLGPGHLLREHRLAAPDVRDDRAVRGDR